MDEDMGFGEARLEIDFWNGCTDLSDETIGLDVKQTLKSAGL